MTNLNRLVEFLDRSPSPFHAVATAAAKLESSGFMRLAETEEQLAGSRAEAEQVAVWAEKLAIPHDILTWTGERPRTKLQELARAARYRLLENQILIQMCYWFVIFVAHYYLTLSMKHQDEVLSLPVDH